MVKKTVPFLIIALYIVISKTVGDHFPFARYDMFSTIPNEVYTFYITDENNIPLDSLHFGLRGLLSNQYGRTLNKHQFVYGKETKEQLAIVGQDMLNAFSDNIKPELLTMKALRIYRVHFFMQNNNARKNEELIFEKTMD
ncbi:hypothetical protein C7N43_00685 [Sphingobacteriales bacterium UPWRP_1]|nr:hypothetical protein B6N25_10420 [Sphingobacteriales bacterium TSM_CSS]PSJ78990.1 hypothetical protein C7N43_00685 [Sphingobacteriales bacterium UPWRP_1]